MKVQSLPLLFLVPLGTLAFKNCALQGADFPAPKKLSSSASFQKQLSELTAALSQSLSSNGTLGQSSPNSTLSIEVFSTHDSKSLFTYHHTPQIPLLGVQKVDSDSMYRIASVTKALAVYNFLMEAGDVHFHEPVTKYVPELRNLSKVSDSTRDRIGHPNWDTITLGNLASQLSGLGRDYSALGEILLGLPPGTDLSGFGLPPLDPSKTPPCGLNPICDRAAFFAGFTKRAPVYASSSAPSYSNVAFQILGYALETITKKPFQETFEKNIIKRLNLAHTSYSKPANNITGVIPDSLLARSAWNLFLGDEAPAGTVYSSSGDLATIGRSILSSAVIPAVQTRRWLKPLSFTSDINGAVGMPWEISRMSLASGRILDLYTKSGGLAAYSSEFVLAPDLDVGFVVLMADLNQATSGYSVVTDLVADVIFPAAEQAAKEEAAANFAGTYVSSDPEVNSSITISTDTQQLGLGISSWIMNSTNALAIYGTFLAGTADVYIRLYPTNLKTKVDKDTQTAWRAVVNRPSEVPSTGLLAGSCISWAMIDTLMYGSAALDEFIFTVGSDGVAKSVSLKGYWATLVKK